MGVEPKDRNMPMELSDRALRICNEFVIISSTLLAVATLLFIARIYTRFRPRYQMLADDYVCVVAYVLTVTNTALFFKSIEWAFGFWPGDIKKLTLGDLERSAFHGIIAQPFWAWAMASIKISVALMLLRFEANTKRRRFLWAMIGFQIVLSTYNMLSQLFGCIPLRKSWDLSNHVDGVCMSYQVNTASQATVQAFVILTDWVFALLPITFLRKVQRPLRERIVIGFLMGLGVFTGVASIVKLKQIVTMHKSGDSNAEIFVVAMWCSIEALIGFIASCVPCLRGPTQRVLERYGIVKLRQTTTYTYGQYPGTRYATQVTTGKTLTANEPPIRLKRRGSLSGESEEQIMDANEQPHVKEGEIWRTTEVHMEEEQRLRAPHSDYGRSEGMTWSGISSSRRLSEG